MLKRTLGIAISAMFVSASAYGAAFTITPSSATAPLGGGATTPTDIVVDYDPEGGTADGFEVEVAFDDAALDVTVSGSCSYTGGSGTIIVIANDAFGNTLPAGTYCTMQFASTAAAAEQVYPLTLQNGLLFDGGAPQPAPTLNSGEISVLAAPPDVVLSFTPAPGGTVTFPSAAATQGDTVVEAIDITGGGSFGSGTVDNCAFSGADAGAFSVTSAQPISVAAGASGTIDLDCAVSDADQTATLTCDVTDSTGAGQESWTMSCPAGAPTPSPEYSSTPAPGTGITCNGAPGSTVNRVVTIENTGNPTNPAGGPAEELTFSCSTSGAAFSIVGPAGDTLLVGESATVTVACQTPAAAGDPANTGSLDCTSNDPGQANATYPLSSGVVTAPPPVPQPNIVPAGSLWSKLLLIGLLAGLGGLIVAMRRQ